MEDYKDMRMQFPEFVTEDSSIVKGAAMSELMKIELDVEGEEFKLAHKERKGNDDNSKREITIYSL
jgi:hypothetical protein